MYAAVSSLESNIMLKIIFVVIVPYTMAFLLSISHMSFGYIFIAMMTYYVVVIGMYVGATSMEDELKSECALLDENFCTIKFFIILFCIMT
jgi:hypothetical protein